jgi:hypothetical protein
LAGIATDGDLDRGQTQPTKRNGLTADTGNVSWTINQSGLVVDDIDDSANLTSLLAVVDGAYATDLNEVLDVSLEAGKGKRGKAKKVNSKKRRV